MNGKNKVCVSYAGGRIEDIDSAIVLCDWLEMRMDLCSFSDDEYKNIFSKINNTIAADHSLKAKENLLKAIELGAKIIDIDINNPDFKEVYSKAKSKNRKIIISEHNFNELPKAEELNKYIEMCYEMKADYSKIACKLNSNKDILTIANLYENPLVTNGDIKLLAMGLGKYGPLSRLISVEFGAPYVYCSYFDDLATAEGQLNIFDFLKIYNKLFVE
ncbi:MAG: type I 3-dehydroquinate dehydratase [bacterium]